VPLPHVLGVFLACNLANYQPDRVFCGCAILRDKAKGSVAVKVGGAEREI